jgi:hypothetical protein
MSDDNEVVSTPCDALVCDIELLCDYDIIGKVPDAHINDKEHCGIA